MLTRLPSASLASTMGLDSSILRPNGSDDARGHVHHVNIVLKTHVSQDQLACALYIDLCRTIDHDVGDAVVGQ